MTGQQLATVAGQFFGTTGEDKVGPNNQSTPNGTSDWHMRVQNAKSNPTTVQIDSFVNGVNTGRWVTPFNTQNWIIAKQFAGGQLDLWFEPYQTPSTFNLKVTYADGTTDGVTGIASGLSNSTLASTSATTAPPSPGTASVPAGQALPIRQWVERPNPTEGQAYMAGRGGKHGRAFYHPGLQSMVFAGGDWHTSMPQIEGNADGTGSEIWALSVLNNRWTLLRPLCVPGQIQPGRPDTVIWAYDSKRDQGLMAPGFYFISQGAGHDCGELAGWGGYAFSFAARTFKGPDAGAGLPAPPSGWGGDTGASYGVYDPIADELVRVRNAPSLERLNLTTQTWRVQMIVKPGDPNWNPIPNRAQSVIDVTGRAIYWIDAWASASPSLVRVSLTDGSITTMPLPAQYKQPAAGDHEIYLAFDPVNRVVFVPNNYDMGASPLTGLGIYHVDTGQWEWEAVPAAAFGSVWGFDQNAGALIGIGKRVSPSAYFLYKYK
jgi:hypothetical protein